MKVCARMNRASLTSLTRPEWFQCLIEKRQYDEAVKWLRLAQAGEEETEVVSIILFALIKIL